MKLQVKLFAAAKQLVGGETAEVDLPAPATVGQLRAALAQQYPELATITGQVLFAVNQQYADDRTLLAADAEVACIPPVSGGA